MGGESPVVELYDSSGNPLSVQNGVAIPANTPALMIAGSDGTNSRYMAIDSSGRPVIVGAGVAGTPAGGVVSIQGVTSGTVVPVSGTVTTTLSPDTFPATANITTQDIASTTTTGANNQLIITGSPTANSAASFTLATQEGVQIQVTGTWTGTLQVESSIDSGTTWYLRKLHQSGGYTPQSTTYSANFLGGTNVTGFTNIRVRAIAAMTGTATVKISESVNTNLVYTATSQPIEVVPAIAQADAFHRLRTSQNVRQWSSMSEYPDFAYLWETQVVSTGTVAWQQFLSCQRLSTGGTGNTASAIRQTRRYMRYQPGKSSLVLMTFVMSAAQTNATAEIGYYDASNGLFFQRAGTTLNVIRRTNVTGTPTDNIIAQSAWNLDQLNGTGPSGVTLDVTKTNILVIDYQWLGVGTARIGFDFGGLIGIVWAHQFANANVLTAVYMSTGCLPLRGRVFNTGTAGGTVTMDMICTMYANEGAAQSRGVLDTDRVSTFSYGTGATLKAITGGTPIPVLSLRAATQYGGTGSGGQPNRGWIVPVLSNIYANNIDTYFELWAGGVLTGASFAPFASYSIADVDTSATALNTTTAFRVTNGYVSASKNGTAGAQFLTPYEIPMVCSGLLGTQDTVTLLMTSIGTGSNSAAGTVSWEERY